MPGAVAAIREAAEGARLPGRGRVGAARRPRRPHRPGRDQVLPGAGIDGLIRLLCLALLDPGDELRWPGRRSCRGGWGPRSRALAPPRSARRRRGIRSRRAAGAGDPAHQARRCGEPQQPDGRGGDRGRPGPVPRRAPGPRPARGRRGLLRVPARERPRRRAPRRRGPRWAPSAPSARPTASRGCGWATCWAAGPGARARRRAERLRRERPRPGGRDREPRGERCPAARPDRAEHDRARDHGGRHEGLGLEPLPSAANFLLVDLGTPERAQEVNAALLARGVIVRPARAFGAPSALRVTVGFPEQNERFLGAAAEALAEVA